MHFTYEEEMNTDNLSQGDIILASDEIIEIINKYTKNEEYLSSKYYIILTQSCDLVKSEHRVPKTCFLTIAPMYNLDYFTSYVCKKNLPEKLVEYKIFDEKTKRCLRDALDKLYENNYKECFFLYKCEERKFPRSQVVFLENLITIKLDDVVYQNFIKEKINELSDIFKAKLGYSFGSLYSRVGTKDWEGIIKETKKEEIKSLLKEFDTIDELGIKKAIEMKTLEEKDIEEIKKKHPHKSYLNKFLELTKETIWGVEEVDDEMKKKIFNRFKNDENIKNIIARLNNI